MQSKTHYCFGEGSHNDGCNCDCVTCIKRNTDIKQELFNEKLYKRISELSGYLQRDSEFRLMVAKELKK